MKYIAVLALVLGAVFALSAGTAYAQLATNKSFMLSADGFAASSTNISDSSADITFSVTQAKSNLELQNGVITIDQKDWFLSDFSGTVLQNGKLFKFNAKATDPQGKTATISGLAKLVDTAAADSIYTITGTIIESQKTTKLVYTSKVSEFTVKPVDKNQKSSVTVKILKGASNPQSQTYQTQTIAHRFNFLSQDRITILPSGTITFVNEDDVPHTLVSGTANYLQHNTYFTPDGKISSGAIAPGKSWSVTYDQKGFFRLFDEKYPYLEATIFVYDTSKIQATKRPLN